MKYGILKNAEGVVCGKVCTSNGELPMNNGTSIDVVDEATYYSTEMPESQVEKDYKLKKELEANDIEIITALVEGDTSKINSHKAKQTALRAKLTGGE